MIYIPRTNQQMAKMLQDLRKKTGLSQAQVGKKASMLPKTISALETKPDNVSIGSLMKLLAALNVEVVLQQKSSVDHLQDEW